LLDSLLQEIFSMNSTLEVWKLKLISRKAVFVISENPQDYVIISAHICKQRFE